MKVLDILKVKRLDPASLAGLKRLDPRTVADRQKVQEKLFRQLTRGNARDARRQRR